MSTDLDRRLAGLAYQGYTYGYPHKTSYRRFDPPRRLADVWAAEPRRALDLYVHVPYCAMRCGFCNLFTSVNPSGDTLSALIDQMAREADAAARALGPARFARMAIGGGTPTILQAEQLDRLFALAASHFGVRSCDVATSIECSPETVSAEKLAVLQANGVTRLSIGVQAFEEQETRAIGRPQKRHVVERALGLIADAKFETVNIDLIYGGEGQTRAHFIAAIDAALACAPQELCLYPLYVRPLTGLGRTRGADMWADDPRLDLYRAARDHLMAEGFAPANMRLFRRTGAAWDAGARHKALTDGTVGIGCGARSIASGLHYSSEYAVGRADVAAILADYRARDPASFAFAHYGTTLDRAEQARRHVILNLMETHGVSRTLYRAQFGGDALDAFPELRTLSDRGFAHVSAEAIRLTLAGLERSDVIGPWLYGPDVTRRMEGYEWR